MIDIHTHILHDVDDGAVDLLESVLMAELAVESGTDILIATPHGNIPGTYRKASCRDNLELIAKRKDELERELEKRGVSLKILTGMEVFATRDLAEKIREGKVLSMPDGKHYMIEFDFGISAKESTAIIEDALSTGCKLIIAHPERYYCVQDNIKTAEKWHDMGCEFQLNSESVLGRTMSEVCRTAAELLDRDFVTYVASDAHDPYTRTTYLKEVYDLLSDVKGENYAARLLNENAKKLTEGAL